ncbi:hypothetical protein Tco_0312675 [Tanacetum coccineum]
MKEQSWYTVMVEGKGKQKTKNIKMMGLDQWEINLKKETEDKIKEGTLQVDQGTDAMTLVLERSTLMLRERETLKRKELLIKSIVDEEGETTVVGCDQNDASIQKEMQKGKLLNLWELEKRLDQSERILQVKIPNPKKMCQYYHKLHHAQSADVCTKENNYYCEGTVYKSDGNIMLHNKALPKDCYKVSIDKSLVDAAFISDVGRNGCTTVLEAVGGFVAWPKNKVVLDPKAEHTKSPIQMITGENQNCT